MDAARPPKTLFEKVWDSHVVERRAGFPDLLYIDRHFIHEVTSPQAFEGLRRRGLSVFRPECTTATADHNVPTHNQHLPIRDPLSRKQVAMLEANCAEFGIELYGLGHARQGIVHVIGPELGLTQPGMTIVCGDSHTSTHGAFGAVAFGIGTSQVEQVLATQCLLQYRPRSMRIEVNGALGRGVTAKDLILYLIARLGTAGGTRHFVEYAGSAIRSLSMEGRMTVCNMSIEMGARGGMIAPDDTTFDYLYGRPFAPRGRDWEAALARWRRLHTDEGATYHCVHTFDATEIEPMITYGTHPGMAIGISQPVPHPRSGGEAKALEYMGIEPGKPLEGLAIDYVFIGSCTNARIEDLRAAATLVKGRKKAEGITVWIVPGSKQVAAQARTEGLDKIFEAAGMTLREPGCSACLAMNEDKVPPNKYCISTSNRNFEGRQGPGARTLLASPLMAAAAALTGKVTDVRKLLEAPIPAPT